MLHVLWILCTTSHVCVCEPMFAAVVVFVIVLGLELVFVSFFGQCLYLCCDGCSFRRLGRGCVSAGRRRCGCGSGYVEDCCCGFDCVL